MDKVWGKTYNGQSEWTGGGRGVWTCLLYTSIKESGKGLENMKTGCRIVKDIKRPEKTLVDQFAGVAVANLDDCMGRMSAVHEDIVPVNKTRLLGTAFTVKVPEGDNLMFHAAMDLAKPGDVIVIDAGGDTRRSVFGELMVRCV